MESPASQAAPSTKPAAGQKKAVSVEAFVFLGVFILIFGLIGHKMGMINLLNTMMNTAFDLLINTVLYIMGIAVLAGRLGRDADGVWRGGSHQQAALPAHGRPIRAAWRCLRWNRHNLPV